MSFFDSEVVRAEMTEVGQLQQEVYTSMFSFYSMTKEDKIKHIDLLSRLLEKQKVLYMIIWDHLIQGLKLKIGKIKTYGRTKWNIEEAHS